MTVDIPHQLTKEEAKKRVSSLLENVKLQFGSMITGLEENWTSDACAFKFSMSGHKVSGNMQLLDKSIKIELTLPFIANMFKGKIQSIIEEQGKKALS